MKIVVTDSGLGGLSVVAELENKMIHYNNTELIFFNSVNSKSYGYNDMGSITEQAEVFNRVLNSIENKFDPDIILIACNTLSIVYPHTEFSRQTKIKVEGIIETGVEYFYQKMNKDDDSILLLFGTPTTVDSQKHKDQLVSLDINENRIFYQACPFLESEIQDDPDSESVKKMIKDFVGQACKQIRINTDNIFAGLCCTHYGYSFKHFDEILKENFGNTVEILNPNEKMSNSIIGGRESNVIELILNIEVVSKVEILANEQIALTQILKEKAPLTINALGNYQLISDLF